MVQNAANENSEFYDCSGSYAETSRQYNRAASVNNQSVPSPTISPAHASPVMHHSTYVNQHIPAPMQQFPAENQSWLAYPAHQPVHAVHGSVHQADQFLQPEDLWRNQIPTGAYTIYPTSHHMALQQQQQQFQHQRMMHEQQQQQLQQQQQQPQQQQLQQHLAAQQAVVWSSEAAPAAPASGSECSSVGTAAPSPTATGSGSEISGPPTPSTSAPSPTSMSSAPRSQQQPGSGSARSSNARSPFEWMRRPNYTAQSGKTRTKDKYRVVYSEHQRLELEKEFYSSRYITIRRKTDLARCLDLSERQIKIWFQNRRAKERKQNKKREEMQRREMKPILDARGLTHPSPMLGLQARQPLSSSPPSSVGMMRHPAVAAPNAHVQPPIAAMASLNINMTNHHMLGMMQHHHFAAAAHHNAAMRAAACAANNGAQQPVAI